MCNPCPPTVRGRAVVRCRRPTTRLSSIRSVPSSAIFVSTRSSTCTHTRTCASTSTHTRDQPRPPSTQPTETQRFTDTTTTLIIHQPHRHHRTAHLTDTPAHPAGPPVLHTPTPAGHRPIPPATAPSNTAHPPARKTKTFLGSPRGKVWQGLRRGCRQADTDSPVVLPRAR